MSSKLERYIWVLPVAWMGVIFAFSHQPGQESAELSGGVTQLLIDFLRTFNIEWDITGIHGIVRAAAHFTIFFILGQLWYITFRFRGISATRGATIALFICVTYAFFDEGHQYFIPGRACDINDVIIDSLGAGTAILIGRSISWVKSLRAV